MNLNRFHALTLCFAIVLAQGEALALGADSPNSSPHSPEPSSTPTTATATTSKAKAGGTKAKPTSAGRRHTCAPHTRTEHFEPGRVYRLQAKRGYVSEIRLGAGDSIADQALSGDTDGWDIASPIGATVVTVKPGSKAFNTNLILRSASRSYLIALEIVPDYSICKGEWQLNFQTPAPPVVLTAEAAGIIAAREAARQAQALREAKEVTPAGRNWSYSMQALPGSDDIVPTEVYDDGRFTYIRIPGNRELSSVFQISSDGTESFVERHMEGRDLMVIHDVSRQWVLRLDKQTVGIWNDAFDIEGVPPVAGARSERIKRAIRGAQDD